MLFGRLAPTDLSGYHGQGTAQLTKLAHRQIDSQAVPAVAVGGDELDEHNRVAGVIGWRPHAQPQPTRTNPVADDDRGRAAVWAARPRCAAAGIAPARVEEGDGGRGGLHVGLGLGETVHWVAPLVAIKAPAGAEIAASGAALLVVARIAVHGVA